MSIELVVIGAGGFGREVLDVIAAVNLAQSATAIDVIGVIDDEPSALNLERLRARGVQWIGTSQQAIESRVPAHYVIGVGSPTVRSRVSASFDEAGWAPHTIVHPAAILGTRTSLGLGSVVCAGVVVSTNVTFGRHAQLNAGVTVGHDSLLGDFFSANPNACISGDVTIGDGVLVGANAVVLQQRRLGARVTVGAMACVTKDVESGLTVVGVPAKPVVK